MPIIKPKYAKASQVYALHRHPAAAEHLASIELDGCVAKTWESNESAWRRYQSWCEATDHEFGNMTSNQWKLYLKQASETGHTDPRLGTVYKPLVDSSLGVHLGIIRSGLAYAADEGFNVSPPGPKIKVQVPDPDQRFFTADELRRALRGLDPKSRHYRRNRLVLLLLIYGGFRVAEIAGEVGGAEHGLRLECEEFSKRIRGRSEKVYEKPWVDLEQRRFVVIGKFHKQREVPMHDYLHAEIVEFLADHPDLRYLFQPQGVKKPLTSKSIAEIVKAALKRADAIETAERAATGRPKMKPEEFLYQKGDLCHAVRRGFIQSLYMNTGTGPEDDSADKWIKAIVGHDVTRDARGKTDTTAKHYRLFPLEVLRDVIRCAYKNDPVLEAAPKVAGTHPHPRAKAANAKQAVDRATAQIRAGASFAEIMLTLTPNEMRALGEAGFGREQIEAMHATGLLVSVVSSLMAADPTLAVV